MSDHHQKPLDNIKKICTDLGNLFEQMEQEEAQILSESQKKQDLTKQEKESTFSLLKQQLADLS